ncbi:unnamed protein product, partial [Symbiodinium sp. KB8]
MFFLLSHVQLPVPVLLVVLAGVVLVPPFQPDVVKVRNSVQQKARRLNMAEATSIATDLVFT